VYDAESNESLIDFEAKYRTAEKEAQIKSQQLEIEKEKAKRNMALAGGGFLILIAGLGFGYFRNKQKQKFLQTQNALLGLQQDLSFKEIESLNKQLDPHEIKNLLGSISPEIQEKAPEAYNNMVKLFKITKASLSKELVEPLNQQLEQIEDYLALEKNMLHVPLNYTISDNSINKNTPIPRLLLKNLVENAVKHGIRLSQSGGEISIEISEADNNLRIVVDDTGVGRKQAIAQDSGIGTSTYLRLFEILNLRNKEQAVFKTLDKNQGTRVQVNIPLNYKYTWK
jgi:LytS/YehU family sensor histidine kinase